MRPPYLSPSGWSTWEQCRRRWKFRYIDGLKDPGSVHTVTGLVVHTMLEMWESHPLAERTEFLWQTLRGWSIEAHSDDLVAAEADPVLVATWSAMSFDAYRAAPFIGGAPREVTHVEVRHETVVAGVPVLLILDRIDRLEDGRAVVVDFKSGAKAKVSIDYKRQMILSAMAAEELTGAEVVRAELWFLRVGERRLVDIEPRAREDMALDLRRAWRQITEACLEDDFPPAPSPLCSWCPHELDCPEGARAARGWRERNPGRAPQPRRRE